MSARASMEQLAQMRAKIDAGTRKGNKASLQRYKQKPLPVCRIGIDPAFRVGGFGVCVIDETGEVRFLKFKGRGLVDFVFWLWSDAPERAIVTIENSNKQNATFRPLTKKVKGKVVKKTIPEIQKDSRDVGKNQGTSEYAVEFCQRKYGKKNVRGISPKEKGAKWPETIFKGVVRSNKHKLTGYTGKEDQRDAYQLAVRY